MDPSDRTRLFDDLNAAIDAMRDFLAGHPGGDPLPAREMHRLERLAEHYHRAHDALGQELERVIRRSAGRPRR